MDKDYFFPADNQGRGSILLWAKKPLPLKELLNFARTLIFLTFRRLRTSPAFTLPVSRVFQTGERICIHPPQQGAFGAQSHETQRTSNEATRQGDDEAGRGTRVARKLQRPSAGRKPEWLPGMTYRD